MKQFFLVSAILLVALFSEAQDFNLEKLGHLTYDIALNDVWAYSSEDSTGVNLIVDLTNLPDEAPFKYFTGEGDISFRTAHNIYIDEFGILYVIGPNYGNGGCIMYDLNEDPLNPKYVGIYDDTYVHDAYARNNKLYTSEIYGGVFSIVDVSDKSNPIILGNAETPRKFTHNAWLSDDENTLFTTDEVSGAWLGAYDISDPTDIKELDRVQSNPGKGVTPHNTHVLNDYLITSYYKDGVTIHDASNPSSIIEVGSFDTSLDLSGGGTDGCWGATPFLPSGNILASDIQTGLYILKPTYKRGGLLSGIVSDSETNEILSDVAIVILNQKANTITGAEGDYSIGSAGSSTVEVQFSKLGYEVLVETVELIEGETVTLDVSLQEKTSFAISVDVYDNNSGDKIPDAIISIINEDFEYNEKADEAGTLALNKFYAGTYVISVGKWGYQSAADTIELNADRNSYSANIVEGYHDNFIVDLGWQVSGNAATGSWERGIPEGTSFYGADSNPGNDVEVDIANFCYVTGNGGGGPGNDDIDDGSTVLTSPIFDLSKPTVPILNYSRWFFTGGGRDTIYNDILTIYISNGTDSVALEVVGAESEGNSTWQDKMFDLTEIDIELTTTMTLIIETGDLEEPHLVEAAFDHFYITQMPVGIANHQYNDLTVQLSENPFTNQIKFTLNDAFLKVDDELTIQFISIDGKIVHKATMDGLNYTWQPNLPKGIYQYYISNSKGFLYTDKIIKL